MSTATLPSAEAIEAAAHDIDYYDQVRHTLAPAAQRQFDRAVDQAYDAANGAPRTLTQREKNILRFAARIEVCEFRTVGHLEQAIRDLFGISATRYYQQLGALLDRPEAARAFPVLVNWLCERRAQRQAQRSARTETAGSAQ